MAEKNARAVWLVLAALLAFSGCASRGAVSAEEYYSLGMAYFELAGKAGSPQTAAAYFEEAEKWLIRARGLDKTKTASEYNLGRIAFERGRYPEAVRYFETILQKDPDNVMALKAAAYTRIRTGDLALAEALYDRVLRLVPESADDGYNYGLVLYALGHYARAEEVLAAYPFALTENGDLLLLYARAQAAQGKIEAADRFDMWLRNNSNPGVRYEYGRLLEGGEFYARALEQYREALNGLPQDSREPSRPEVRFTMARLLLIADSENDAGMTELRLAVDEGFNDREKIAALLDEKGIREAAKGEIRRILEKAGEEEEEEGPVPPAPPSTN